MTKQHSVVLDNGQTAQVGDLLFFHTVSYQPAGWLAWINNRGTRFFQGSAMTHVGMIVDIQEVDDHYRYVLLHSEPYKNVYLDVMDDDELDNGYHGKLLRYTGEKAAEMHQWLAHYAFSYMRGGVNTEHHSLVQSLLASQPKLMAAARYLGVSEQGGIHSQRYASRFANRHEPAHGQQKAQFDGTFCSKLMAHVIELSHKTEFGMEDPEHNYQPYPIDYVSTSMFYDKLKQLEDFTNLGNWHCKHPTPLSDEQNTQVLADSKVRLEADYRARIAEAEDGSYDFVV